jgi:hypothetical protein
MRQWVRAVDGTWDERWLHWDWGQCSYAASHAISPRMRLGEISRSLLSLSSMALGKPSIRTFSLGLRERYVNTRAGLHREVL